MINRAMTQVRFKRRPGLKRYADDGATLPPSSVFLPAANGIRRSQSIAIPPHDLLPHASP
ncbi:hypothetical protein NtRootA1_40940 [Arthrobacter sp. NtRootA1]|nr:hypothetical protein NtRootA1_40940 [Arthrobacter sp. NtRootA1]